MPFPSLKLSRQPENQKADAKGAGQLVASFYNAGISLLAFLPQNQFANRPPLLLHGALAGGGLLVNRARTLAVARHSYKNSSWLLRMRMAISRRLVAAWRQVVRAAKRWA